MLSSLEYEETLHISEFRNSVLYGSKVNSIAEWMLSPEWTTPKDNGPMRGVISRGEAVINVDEIAGEFETKEPPPVL